MNNLYWITRLDAILDFSHVLILVGAIGLVASFLIRYVIDVPYSEAERAGEYIDKMQRRRKEKYGWTFKLAIPILILGVLLSLFVPSRDEAIFIFVGGKTMEYVASDTSLSKLPYQTTKFLSDYMDKKLKELK